ncbi:MAG: hypothetical protein CMO55_17995 [Verrucomicrobiales bacterium]|nr:hypothetical protein [Verrucomicrobiales bacterium]
MTPERVFSRFRLYCRIQCLVYLLVGVVGIVILAGPPAILEMEKTPALVLGGIFLAMGLFFLFLFSMGLNLPQRPGAWVIGLVLIFLGVTNLILVAFAMSLLRSWRKPEMEAWFGRNPS